jgi:hypothetical protein
LFEKCLVKAGICSLVLASFGKIPMSAFCVSLAAFVIRKQATGIDTRQDVAKFTRAREKRTGLARVGALVGFSFSL